MNKLYEEESVRAIADAIREKNGSSDTYTVAQMGDAVRDLPTGVEIPVNTKFSHTQPTIIKEIFYNDGLDTSDYTDMSYMFANCCDKSRGSGSEEYLLYLSKLKTQNVTDMEGMFQNNNYMKSWDNVHFENFDTSNVTNMSYMFSHAQKYLSDPSYSSNINLSTFDTSNVTNMSYMFDHASIDSLNLSNWNTSSVTNMGGMFSQSNINVDGVLDISHFDVSHSYIYHMFEKFKVGTLIANNWNLMSNDLRAMFKGCSGSLVLQNWTIPSGAQFGDGGTSSGTFQDSTGLTSLDLSGWNAPNIASTKYMFYRCTSLEYLDISGFDLTTITSSSNYNSMFGSGASYGPPNNCLIYVKDQANKDWINSKFSRLTNVQIKA